MTEEKAIAVMMILGMELNVEKKKTALYIKEGLSIPLWLIAGSASGPTLVVSAGVHGCEYIGILAARKLFDEVDPAGLKGW